MVRHTRKLQAVALLLAILFLAAQFHFCTDLTTATSHFCPVCSTADSVAPTAPIHDAGLVLAHRVDALSVVDFVSVVVVSAISPRAPPAL